MSSPIPSFRNLNITPMQSTWSGGSSGAPKGKGKGRAVDSELESEEEYSDTEEESQESEEEGQGEEQEAGGVTNLFALDQCRQHTGMYSFQMAHASLEVHGIRIKPEAEPHCSCNERNCQPMRWLWQHINQIYNQGPVSPPLTPHEQISNIGLHNICESLDGEMREGFEDWRDTTWRLKKDYSVHDPRHRTRAFTRERMRSIRDIMATLSDSETIPDDYRNDLFDAPDDLLMGDILVLGDLENTMVRLLIMDDNVFGQFKALVSSNIRDSQYFRKMTIKVRKTFELLDDYCENGSPPPGHQAHTVIWCAQTLVDIVHNISVNINERQPLSPELREEAANILVSILSQVVDRNWDAYQKLKTSQRRRPHGEQTRVDGNLYNLLIGSGSSPKNPSCGNFILNDLQDLPEARSRIEVLEGVLGNIVTIGWGPAPRAYTNKLERIINQLRGATGPSIGSSVGGPSPGARVGTGTAGGPSTSSGKRPAGSMGGRAKRMK